MPDGILVLQLPPIPPPESAMLPGMAAPASHSVPHGVAALLAPNIPDTSIGPVALQEPPAWSYDFDPANGIARASFPGEVTVAGNPVGGPTTGSGAIVLQTSPALLGTPTAPTRTAGVSDTSLATTAFVQGASRNPNYVNNSGFSVNQRVYVSGTALAAGTFGHDRWKGGAGGGTYTFAAGGGPSNTITITAGTLQQVVEGASLAGGSYTLSWTGTAQGRVGAGAYAASPVAIASITAGTNTTIEFNAGTLSQVKLEMGLAATPWFPLQAQEEWANCQRFYQTGASLLNAYSQGGNGFGYEFPLPVNMRALPTAVLVNSTGSINLSGFAVAAASSAVMGVSGNTTATGQCALNIVYTASADL
jgi:hypothetical protein